MSGNDNIAFDLFVKVNELPNKTRLKELWYYDSQKESFLLFLETKKGYLVLRPNDSRKWLIKKEHAKLISVDE